MITVRLYGNKLASEHTAVDYIIDRLDLPDFYGNDLGAIYDALADITEETEVIIIDKEAMDRTSFGSKLIWIFEDAAEDNDKLWLDWQNSEDSEL